jgi:polyketide biosynthesis 3-hydroxy-3-methylglutaryl-CoA synthase-like enzyme PksG
MTVGVERINAYFGKAYIDVRQLFDFRKLDIRRFDNLLMEQKSCNFPCEDAVSNAVNAAKPIIDQLSDDERNSIATVITATESGIDFGKSISTYVSHYLNLSKHCRLFEVKNACYGGTAALQMAAGLIESGALPNGKVLVIATDVARAAARMTYAEPSQGTGAVAMLISDQPNILELDFGANGLYGYEVMDTCRPTHEIETGDADLSLLSYLDCLSGAYRHYQEQVGDVDVVNSFAYLLFHTPFAGMVKGAHRNLLKEFSNLDSNAIDTDFRSRVVPGMGYNVRVGNLYSASVYLALCSLIDSVDILGPERIGLFSYGSGCSSEFFSGLLSPDAKEQSQSLGMLDQLEDRVELSIEEYDRISDQNMQWHFGIENKVVDFSQFQDYYEDWLAGRDLLILKEIKGYHREYDWS